MLFIGRPEQIEKKKGNLTMSTVALVACVILLITTTTLLVLQWMRLQGVLKVNTLSCIAWEQRETVTRHGSTVAKVSDSRLRQPGFKFLGTFVSLYSALIHSADLRSSEDCILRYIVISLDVFTFIILKFG